MFRICGPALPLIFMSLVMSACSQTFPAANPLGSPFPEVRATVLTGEEVTIPAYFKGKPVLILIGYVQDSQFDIDRWILALKQLETPIRVAELPTIQGFFPRLISNQIDSGMRSGIPEEDWKIVFTVYGDAEKIARLLGNERPRNGRVVLVDEAGKVSWFHDRGFSADRALELDALVRQRFPQ